MKSPPLLILHQLTSLVSALAVPEPLSLHDVVVSDFNLSK